MCDVRTQRSVFLLESIRLETLENQEKNPEENSQNRSQMEEQKKNFVHEWATINCFMCDKKTILLGAVP